MLNVVCFLWGDWPARGWGPEYVSRLARGVERNLTLPYTFICFSDKPNALEARGNVEIRPLHAPSWLGCLPKAYAYCPTNGLSGRTLILDLDNVIVGSLDGFASYRGPFAVRAQFSDLSVPDGDMISFEANSVISWHLWNALSSDPRAVEEETGGRERLFIRHRVRPDTWQDTLGPESVLSYKRHLQRGESLPAATSIVSFHDKGKSGGHSRPHQLLDKVSWLNDHWK